MVVINTTRNMFWGVTVDSGKRYSQVVNQTFHLSMAALEPGSAASNEFVQVMVQHGSSEFLLCTLQQGKLLQQPLDLMFASGEELAFSLTGKGVVHLTGYMLNDEPDEDDFDYDSEDEDEESDAPQLIEVDADSLKAGTKRKAIESSSPAKKTKLSEVNFDNDDDSEDDEDYDVDEDGDDDEDDEDDDEEFSEDDLTFDEDEDSDIDEFEEDEEESTPAVKAKTPVVTPKGENASSAKKDKQAKGKANDKSQQSTPTKSTPGKSTPAKEKAKTPKSAGEGGSQKAPQTPNTPANGESESAKKKKKKKKKNKNKDGESSMNESTTSSPEKSSGESTPKSASKKDGKKEGKKEGTPKIETPGKRKVVAGGTVVEDTKVGHGPEAKPGKMVSVYYVGTLSKNNKQFDSCTNGKPFRFRLKQGEVIKGWDNGVEGMKVGGKRKITVPANQAYGNQRQGPIPANSALTFEVELKAVS